MGLGGKRPSPLGSAGTERGMTGAIVTREEPCSAWDTLPAFPMGWASQESWCLSWWAGARVRGQTARTESPALENAGEEQKR